VAVKYGKPMLFGSLRTEAKDCGKERTKEIYQQVADEIMIAISALEPRHEPQDYVTNAATSIRS
jgi:hypothetical protein